MFYIGAAENFKNRFANHQKSFRHEKYKTETELSKYIWNLRTQLKTHTNNQLYRAVKSVQRSTLNR